MQLKFFNKKNNIYLLLILIISSLIKLIFIINLDNDILNLADQSKYIRISDFILENKHYPDMPNKFTNRVPIYPYFLFMLRSFFDNLIFVIIIQNIISCFLIILVYNLSKLVLKKLSILITFIFSINLNIILHTNLLLTDFLFLFYFMIFLYFFIKFMKKKTIKNLVFASIILGISTLIRPQTQFFPIIILISIFLLLNDRFLKKVKFFLIFIIIFKSITFSWEVRNYNVHGKFFFDTSKQTNLVGYYLPHFDQYEFGKSLEDSKKNRRLLWKKYIVQNNFQNKDFIDLEEIVVSYTKEEFFKYKFLTVFNVLSNGIIKNLFTPTYSDISYWYQVKKTSFSKTEGASFFAQTKNFLKVNNNSYSKLLIISTIILFFFRILEFFGLLKYIKKDFQLSIFFLLIIGYFLILMGPIGQAKYRIPYEYFLSIYLAIVFDYIRSIFFLKKIKD
jgi:hypothetical protein